MALADTARLAVRIDLEGNAAAGVQNLTRKVNGLGAATGKIGRGFGQLGAGIAKAGLVVGGGIVTGLGAAAKAAIDFEDAFAGVKKTVDEGDLKAAGLSFDQLARSFRDMATEVPIAATEFARLGETAGALGVKAGDIDEFVRTTALLGVTTNLTADDAADALGRIGTILQFTGKDYEDFADSLVALGNAGASTESEIIEISKRFAAEGKAAGLAKEDVAGLASATASLGFAPERGGTALARVFANMGTNIALANKKGKAFASVTGRSITDLQKSLDKGDGLDVFLDVLKGIKGLSPTEANRVLKSLGITNTSDRTIFRSMADNLPFVNEQLGIATRATGALSEEATKRFDTVRSKLQLLKNNLIEAGITIGEGFAPAIGRAAEKLSDFLKQDGNRAELKALGEDIGKAIDDIDWQAVLRDARSFVGVLKSAFDWTMRLVTAFNRLPNEIKGAVAGLLAVNKLSGGLVGAGLGNIVGGIGETIARAGGSRLPGVGKLFAQPVFVTNWPLGGLPGAGGAVPAGGGGLGKVAALGVAGAIVAAAVPIGEAFASALPAELKGGGGKGMSESQTRITAALQHIAANTPAPQIKTIADPRDVRPTQEKLDHVKAALVAQRQGEQTIGQRTQARIDEAKRETARGTTIMAATQRSGSASIVSAIYANRPITNVSVSVSATTVQKNIVKTTRYGPPGGSRNQNSNGSGTLGNGGR